MFIWISACWAAAEQQDTSVRSVLVMTVMVSSKHILHWDDCSAYSNESNKYSSMHFNGKAQVTISYLLIASRLKSILASYHKEPNHKKNKTLKTQCNTAHRDAIGQNHWASLMLTVIIFSH